MATLTHLPETSTLAEACRRFRARKLSLFGSAARGEMRDDSDIDLLVEFLPDAHPSYFSLVEFSEALETIFGGAHRVDLVLEADLHPLIRRHVLPDLITLYEG